MSTQDCILITGGTGFAGSHLVDLLLAQGATQVHVTSYGPSSGHVAEVLPQDNLHSLDLTNHEATLELLHQLKPAQIYHLASIAGVDESFSQAQKIISSNSDIQLSLLSAVAQACPEARILSIGSAIEYQSSDQALAENDRLAPASPYGVSKVAQEMIALWFMQQHQLDIVLTRSFNHFGPRQASGFVVADFAQQISQKPSIIKVGNLEAKRDMTYVKDVVQAYELLMTKGESGEVYNVGSGEAVSIKELLELMIKFSGHPIKVEIDPKRYRPIDVPKVEANIDKIEEMGWRPTTQLNQALKDTLDYYTNNK